MALNKTTYLQDEVIKHILRTGSFTKPSALYVGLIDIVGAWTATTNYSINDIVVPTVFNGRMYIVTNDAGSSAGSEPTFPTTDGGTVVDGGITWTEMTLLLKDDTGTTVPEMTGTGYARVQRDPLDANWTATSGNDGQSDNAAAITFGSPTSNWGVAGGFFIADALTVGNMLYWGVLADEKTINNGDAAPSFGIGALTVTEK